MTTTEKNTRDAAKREVIEILGTDVELSSSGENDLMDMLRDGRHPAYQTLRCRGVTIGVRIRGKKT